MARVSLRKLSVQFGAFTAVDDLSLDIGNGELVVFLGPSGCGKTTTLRCIAGLERPTAGDILFDERRVNELQPSERNIAMVFQFVSLYPHLKVKDNIVFPLRARGAAKATIRAKLEWIVETFKLADIVNHYPGGLPPGAKQKVALARAVVREPNVLLLDEPLSAIDEQFREEMRWELGHLQKQLGFTTVYVTHDQREAMSLADRIVLMKDGTIVQAGPPRELYTQPANEFAGFFIGSPGMNFIAVAVAEDRLLLGQERLPLIFDRAACAQLRQFGQRPLLLGIRPQHVTLAEDLDALGILRTRIVDSYSVGREYFFDFLIDGALYQGLNPRGLGLREGLGIRFAPEHTHFFDKTTGERLRHA